MDNTPTTEKPRAQLTSAQDVQTLLNACQINLGKIRNLVLMQARKQDEADAILQYVEAVRFMLQTVKGMISERREGERQ
jgi:hypothetical protein